ncbi:MAG: hypothetical protein AAF560_30805 [Acidobacteriota bacterium]
MHPNTLSPGLPNRYRVAGGVRLRIAVLVALLLSIVLPASVAAQLPPPGVDPEPIFQTAIQAATGSAYSHFEVTLYAAPDGLVDANPMIASTMPTVVLSGFVQRAWGEELLSEVTLDPAAWGEVATLMLELTDYLDLDLTTLDPNADLLDIIDDLIDSVEIELPEDADDLIEQLLTGLLEHGVEVLASLPFDGPSCLVPFLETIASLSTAIVAHFPVLSAIFASPVTCLNPNLFAGGQAKCAVQVVAWGTALGAMVSAVGASFDSYGHHTAFVQYSNADQIGETLHATDAHAAAMAREAKLMEQAALAAKTFLEAASFAIDRITDLGAGDPVLAQAAGQVSRPLGYASTFWNATHKCMRRVISPRLQASTIRNRVFIESETGWVPLAIDGALTVTSLPRSLAKSHAIELDVEALYAANPGLISTFNTVDQNQSLFVYVCEGVILEEDPGSLINPLQYANTEYFIGNYTSAGDCVSTWWTGLDPILTEMIRPLPPTTMHRACESLATELVDNNNDGVADASPSEHCYVYEPPPGSTLTVHPDPEGELEEDMFWGNSVPFISGPTAFSQMGVDMLCNGVGLSLVSPDGLTQRTVRQEVVFNAASCWTRESDGHQAEDHPHDSTQLRLVLQDGDWGAPRPRECFVYNPTAREWECSGFAGCLCIDEIPDPIGIGPQ